MTLIEFFDHSPLQNLSGVLRFPVDSVYFVGANSRKMSNLGEIYRKIWIRHGKNVSINTVCIPTYDMCCAADKLCEIIRAERDVIIDVSGGSDYLLAAAGIAYERCKDENVRLHHISVRSGKIVSFEKPLCLPEKKLYIKLTCDEVIELHGGKITYEDEKKSGTVIWDFEKDGFREDVMKMWDICKRDARYWNRICTRVGELENLAHSMYGEEEDGLNVDLSKRYAYAKNKKQLLGDVIPHLKNLNRAGLITGLVSNKDVLQFSFKNKQVRSCLLKAGNVLELMCYLAATEVKNKKGYNIFCDTLSGVVLDWDGVTDSVADTENEIDGLFIKGMIPVFVSCKNGAVDENELYKLNSVAEHFGTRYAKKMLVATDLQKNYSSLRYFKARASEMGVTVIDGVHKMSFEELCRKIGNI